MKLLFATVLTFTIPVAGCALAQSPSAAQIAKFFTQIDSNRDGVVSRNEMQAFRQKTWPRIDRNGDGVLSPTDAPAFSRQRQADIAVMVQTGDQNGDGMVTQAEFLSSPMQAFDVADVNGDNVVTRAEAQSATR